MTFMICWSLSPENQKSAAEAFVKTGAPMPDGLTLLGRWHAPGSSRGWAMVETDDLGALSEHLVQWGNLLELEVTPVVDDETAGQAMAKVYGE